MLSNSSSLFLIGSDLWLPWLLNPDLWLPDSSNGFTHSHAKNTTGLSVLNLCEQNTVLYESTRARERQNIHVTAHHGGESSTWLWRARQPQLYIQEDEPFHSPHQRNAGPVSNNCGDPGDGKRRGSKLTVQGYSLNICPFWSWRLPLTLISFCYW